MPFIQRLIEPVNLAQTAWVGHASINESNLKQFRCECCKCQNSKYETFTRTYNDNNFILNSSKISCQSNATYYEPNIASDSGNRNNNNNNSNRSKSTNGIEVTVNDENAAAPLSPMKKLKQHVEFSSTSSPSKRLIYTNTASANVSTNACGTSLSDTYWQKTSTRLCSYSSSTIDRKKSAFEFDSITNITLSNTLRQLASLVLIASDIFDDLQKELQYVGERACEVQHKILTMERRIKVFDSKMIKIPEGDLVIYAQCKIHYKCEKSCNNQLFTVNTRPLSVRVLYEKADSPYCSTISNYSKSACIKCKPDMNTEIATITIKNKDDVTNNDRKISATIDTEIEIRLPATFEDLRKWTSNEALGDVTVTPDCMHYVNSFLNTSSIMTDNIEDHASYVKPSLFTTRELNDDILLPDTINENVPLNHRLPSPEEQCKTIALKYPAEIVPVDVSGKGFRRMCSLRASVMRPLIFLAAPLPKESNCQTESQTIKRRSRSFRGKTKRRNTIAGTDQKELCVAANSSKTIDNENIDLGQSMEEQSKKLGRSKSSDVLKKDGATFPYDKGKSTLTRFNALKQWGRSRFKLMQRSSTHGDTPSIVIHVDSDCAAKSENSQSKGDKECTSNTVHDQHKNVNRLSKETKRSILKSPSKNVTICQNVDMPSKQHLNVQLRDTTCLNRLRHNVFLNSCNEDQPHSSSGNWSASSESGRTSIGSEITPIPKSSASNTSLNAFNNCQNTSGTPFLIFTRRKFLNTSTSNSVTSESTLTPELAAVTTSENISNQLNDDETSSAYSCDTEGYYTSFHMDSGLRTLKEEDVPIINTQPDDKEQSTNFVSRLINRNTPKNNLELTFVAENDYELFGHGSTSTTTSSAGTVCTSLRIKNYNNTDRQNVVNTIAEPNDELELTEPVQSTQIDNANSTCTAIENEDKIILSKDERLERKNKITLNTCNNQQISSANSIKQNEFEHSGSSDLESVERVERIKQKTIIRSKHIPSMCVITPSTSDDENESEQNNNNNSTSNNNNNYIDCKKSNNLKMKCQEQVEDKVEPNKIETPFNSHNENKNERNENIQSSKDKIPKKFKKQQKPSTNECVNLLNSMLTKNTVIHENVNSERVNSKSLDNFCSIHTTQPPPSSACFLTKSSSTHVRLNMPDTLKNNKKSSYSWEKCYRNESESENVEFVPPLNSESHHFNEEEVFNNSDSINIANEKKKNNYTNFTLSESLLSSHTNNEMYKNPSTTSALEQRRLLVKNNNESIYPQEQEEQQQHPKSLMKDIICSTPIKPKDDCKSNGSNFNRARPIYWTLQNKKYIKDQPIASSRLPCRDDTYTTLNRNESPSSYPPIVRSKCEALSSLKPSYALGIELDSERFNTCADRTGKAKTSLMDFKKLLLAKSVQTNVLPKKMSAVELLKKNPTIVPLTTNISNDTNGIDFNTKRTVPQMERNLKLLQLNGSPKKFANRRMLRQGQFGLPSQSLSCKSSSPRIWNNNSRTEIISTIIPEVHGEIDQNIYALDNSSDLECTNSDKLSNSTGGKNNEINASNDNINVIQAATKQIIIPTLETAL